MTEIAEPNTDDAQEFVSWSEFLGSPYAPSLALVCLAVWLHAADSLIVATMLPAIVTDVGGKTLVGWTVSLYEIASVVAGAASALLTLRHGLRLPMSLAAAAFGVGCVLSALAPNMPVVLLGRILQGFGGGGLVAMSFVAVGVLFPRRYAARALAAVSALWGVSAFVGPLIGGLFVEYASWRWGFACFALQAFGLAAWIAWRPNLQHEPSAEASPFPMRRLALLCLAVLLVCYGGVNVTPVQTTVLVGLGLILLSTFLWLDQRAGDDRLLPNHRLPFRGPFGAALLMILCLAIATIAIGAYGPLLMTMIHGISALTAGYILACSSFGWTATAIIVSGSPERLDGRMIRIGISLVAVSVAGFVYAVPQGPMWLIAIFSTMEGAGFGLAWTFVLRQTTALVPPDDLERMSGAIPTVQRLGYALGAAYVGIVANALGFEAVETGPQAAQVATWIFAACLPFAALGMIGMVRLLRVNKDQP